MLSCKPATIQSLFLRRLPQHLVCIRGSSEAQRHGGWLGECPHGQVGACTHHFVTWQAGRYTYRAPPPNGIQAPGFWPAGVSQRSGLKASGLSSPAHLQAESIAWIEVQRWEAGPDSVCAHGRTGQTCLPAPPPSRLRQDSRTKVFTQGRRFRDPTNPGLHTPPTWRRSAGSVPGSTAGVRPWAPGARTAQSPVGQGSRGASDMMV